MYFKKDEDSYIENFLKNVIYPSNKDISNYFKKGSKEELEELLTYVWEEEKLQKVLEKGVKIEVYLGAEDKIIDALKAKNFFKNYATVYYFKNKGHLL
jgi:NurA-like 5'-3' nuclease